jgi:hypothetical protein
VAMALASSGGITLAMTRLPREHYIPFASLLQALFHGTYSSKTD